MPTHDPYDNIPDVRDGLTARERIVLQCLAPCSRNVVVDTCQRVCCTGVWSSIA